MTYNECRAPPTTFIVLSAMNHITWYIKDFAIFNLGQDYTFVNNLRLHRMLAQNEVPIRPTFKFGMTCH